MSLSIKDAFDHVEGPIIEDSLVDDFSLFNVVLEGQHLSVKVGVVIVED